jgi:hypothetical protein
MSSKLLPLAMLAAAVQLAGCQATESAAPWSNQDGEPAIPPSLAGGASPVIVSELAISAVAGSGLSGSTTLTRSSQGLWADIEVDGLTDGYAYSVWWAVFDNPQGCDAPCDATDLRGTRQAQGSLVNGGGFVADGSTASHQSHLARHDVEGKSVEAGDPSGIDNTYGAEVHLVIRSHGLAETDPEDLAVQTGTFGTFCNLPDPPVVGGCLNVGASMFSSPGTPGQAGSQ